MKKQNKAEEAKQNKQNKNRKIAVVVSVSVAVVAIALLIVLPLIKINSDFDRIFEKMASISDPEVVITDMGAENVFGSNKGEVRVISADLVGELCELSEKFRYHGRDSDSMSAWDIRFRVNSNGEWLDIFLDEDNMYYVKGGNYYRFVPKNEETEKSYAELLSNVKKLLEK